ncbi:hypothetical protein [Bacillus songklensis]
MASFISLASAKDDKYQQNSLAFAVNSRRILYFYAVEEPYIPLV